MSSFLFGLGGWWLVGLSLAIDVKVSFAGSAWPGERTRVLPWLCLFLNRADLLSYVAGVCDRPFTTVNLGAAQLSCAQLMIQFVPGDLVVARSVVMAGFGVCEMCMPVHDDRKWWSCGEASGNSSDTSVTDGGDGQSQWVWQQVVFIMALPWVTAQLLALDSCVVLSLQLGRVSLAV